MPEGAFFEQKRLSPTSLGIVIALHGAALTALAMAKQEFVVTSHPIPDVFFIKEKKDPPPEPQRVPPETLPPETVTYVKPIVTPVVQRPIEVPVVEQPPIFRPPVVDPRPLPQVDPPAPPQVEKSAPVRIAAVMRSDADLQPPYPAGEQRAGAEGSVTVRIVIGTDGRVKSVTKLRAASDDFFRATERQALRHWRFKPAMVDGEPVESTQNVTVHFQLMG